MYSIRGVAMIVVVKAKDCPRYIAGPIAFTHAFKPQLSFLLAITADLQFTLTQVPRRASASYLGTEWKLDKWNNLEDYERECRSAHIYNPLDTSTSLSSLSLQESPISSNICLLQGDSYRGFRRVQGACGQAVLNQMLQLPLNVSVIITLRIKKYIVLTFI